MAHLGTPNFPLTKHAKARCRQRGIPFEVVQFVLGNFDLDHDAGAGVTAISISRARVHLLEKRGDPHEVLERAARTVLLIAENGAVVTAINRPTWHNRGWTGARKPQGRPSRRRSHQSYLN